MFLWLLFFPLLPFLFFLLSPFLISHFFLYPFSPLLNPHSWSLPYLSSSSLFFLFTFPHLSPHEFSLSAVPCSILVCLLPFLSSPASHHLLASPLALPPSYALILLCFLFIYHRTWSFPAGPDTLGSDG